MDREGREDESNLIILFLDQSFPTSEIRVHKRDEKKKYLPINQRRGLEQERVETLAISLFLFFHRRRVSK